MKKRLFIGLALGLLVLLLAPIGPAQAQGVINEVIYLVDSAGPYDSTSHIYRVDIDTATNQANLTLVVTLTGPDYATGWNNVDVLAASPDGNYLYFIDNSSSGNHSNRLARYEISTDTLTVLANPFYDNSPDFSSGNFNTDQGAIGPDGYFYITRNEDNSLWYFDLADSPPSLHRIGNIPGVNCQGGDIAFGADGTLYQVTKETYMTLYALNNYMPGSIGPIGVTMLGICFGDKGDTFNGLAVRDAGEGDLIGSSPTNDNFRVLSKINASNMGEYTLAGDLAYLYKGGLSNGDLTTGPLTVCTLTIGYWKTHDWDGATVTICGHEINEELGKEILWDARGNNFSMLFAQLIAAKLNVNNSIGFSVINDAEAWLCSLGIFDGATGWNTPFDFGGANKKVAKDRKAMAVMFWDALDVFNNTYHCDEL